MNNIVKTKDQLRTNTIHPIKSIGLMIRLAYQSAPSVLVIALSIIVTSTGSQWLELYMIPQILKVLEQHAPWSDVLTIILLFSIGLFVARAVTAYLDNASLFGRIHVRTALILKNHHKYATTSFENLMDTAFIEARNKAYLATSSNSEATEAIWKQLISLLSESFIFAVYIIVLRETTLLLLTLVIATAVLGFYVNKRADDWAYSKREERKTLSNRIGYVNKVSTNIDFAKDIRLFNMTSWLKDVREKAFRLYYHFQGKIAARYLIVDAINLVLTILRNAIAYYSLIRLVLENALPAASFVLYFTAYTKLSEKTGLLLQTVATLRKQCDEIRDVYEYLHWPEPFSFENKMPFSAPDNDGKYTIRFENVSYRYPDADHLSLHNINFTFHPGEKLAVVGMNGAGKTTLVRLLCGFLDPTDGRVLLSRVIRRRNTNADACARTL